MAIPNRGSILDMFRGAPQRQGKPGSSRRQKPPGNLATSRPIPHSPIIGSCSSQNTCAAEVCDAPALRTAYVPNSSDPGKSTRTATHPSGGFRMRGSKAKHTAPSCRLRFLMNSPSVAVATTLGATPARRHFPTTKRGRWFVAPAVTKGRPSSAPSPTCRTPARGVPSRGGAPRGPRARPPCARSPRSRNPLAGSGASPAHRRRTPRP